MTQPQFNVEQMKASAAALTYEARKLRVGQEGLIKLTDALGPLLDAISDILQHQVDVAEVKAQQLDAQAAQFLEMARQGSSQIVVPILKPGKPS